MSTSTPSVRQHRHRRVRARVAGTPLRPRLAVYRSLRHIRVQLIDDGARVTLLSVNDAAVTAKTKSKLSPRELALEVGKLVAQAAKAKGIHQVVFDRGGYAYHGRVAAVAQGAREGGLEF